MAWTVLVAKAAQKQLTKFPANDQQKIAAALRSLSETVAVSSIARRTSTTY